MSINDIAEARRQIEICNACRYCEGYCSVFPAITRQRSFSDGDITQLANLCHNCRGCYYACQYTDPHEFRINIPQVLSDVRVESWQRFVPLRGLSSLFQTHGVAIAVASCIGFAIMFWLIQSTEPTDSKGFYQSLAHVTMITIFIPAFLAPIVVIGVALRRYWSNTGGETVRLSHLISAFKDAANLKNLSGGQGQGCNFESEDKFTNQRRWLHQAAMGGFLLCFASTASGTLLHYVFGIEAPYPLLSIPKLLGLPGGILLVVGCAGLAGLKVKADPTLGATKVWGGEMAFVILLGLTGASGLLLYAATGTESVSVLLALHLGIVLAFFVSTPFTKMVHGFFRMAALVRDAQLRNP